MHILLRSLRVLTLSVLLVLAVHAAESGKKNYDLPAGDAAVRLKQFSETSGRETLFAAEAVRGVRTAAVKGEFTPEEALDHMLDNTGLIVVQDEKTGALAIRRDSGPNAQRAALEKSSDRPTSQSKVEDGKLVLDKYEVTGSRIRGLLGEVTPNAVITYDRAELDRMGVHSFYDLARYIPQLSIQGAFDPETQGDFGSQFRGTSTVFNDLRGLGDNFTLVLVNGRRLPKLQQNNGSDNQDLNGIPLSAVERIEILPAGASAVYGTDAVTGVINIILKKNYQGTELNLSYRNTWATDSGIKSGNLNYGFARGNFAFMANLEWSETNSLAPRDRWWNATSDRRPFGGTDSRSPVPGGPGVVTSTNGANLPGLTTSIAAIPANSDGVHLTIADFANSGPIPDKTDVFKYVDNATTKSRGLFVSMEEAWRPWASFHVNGRWGEKIAYRPGNYTLPIIGTGSVSRAIPIGRVVLPAGYTGNPFGVPIVVQKVFWDLIPYLAAKETSTNPSLEFGVHGDLPHAWAYESYMRKSWAEQVQFGSTSLAQTTGGLSRFNAAINNTNPTLRPILLQNSLLFSPNSNAIMQSLFQRRPITSNNVNWEYGFKADGPLYSLKSGDISGAVSTVLNENYVDTAYAPDDTLQDFQVKNAVHGRSQDYTMQLQIPLAGKDRRYPLVYDLRLNGAFGGTRQTTPNGTSTVTDLSIQWQPARWLTLRINRNESYKLSTLYQAFVPATTTVDDFGFLGPLIPAVFQIFDPLRGNTTVDYSSSDTTGGNPNLKPQRGETRGASLEVEVPAVPGLKFAAVYSITDIRDEIAFGSENYQAIVRFFPERVTRAPLTSADQALGYTGGIITAIDARNLNLSRVRTANLDLSAEYQHRFGNGSLLGISLKGTKPIDNFVIAVPGSGGVTNLTSSMAGRYTVLVNWNRRAWGAGGALRYTESQIINSAVTTAGQPIPSYKQVDMWVAYDFGQSARRFTGWRGHLLQYLKITLRGLDIFPQAPQFQKGNGYIVGRGNPYQGQYEIDLSKKF